MYAVHLLKEVLQQADCARIVARYVPPLESHPYLLELDTMVRRVQEDLEDNWRKYSTTIENALACRGINVREEHGAVFGVTRIQERPSLSLFPTRQDQVVVTPCKREWALGWKSCCPRSNRPSNVLNDDLHDLNEWFQRLSKKLKLL